MKRTLQILSSLLITVSCTKEANIELPKQEEKLVVTCFISPDEEMTTAVVRTSSPKFAGSSSSGGQADVVTDATVVISGNGQQVTVPFNDTLYCNAISASAFKILPGMTYNLTVTTPDGKTTSASATVPLDTLRFSSVDLETTYDASTGNLDVSYSAEAEDLPGQTNFVAFYHHVTVMDPNNSGEEFGNYSIGTFDDDETKQRAGYSIFEQMNYQSYYGSGGPDSMPVRLNVNILNCSKDFYLFNKSLQAAGNGGDSPFGDPVMVYTNIKNGFGCFGAYRKSGRTLTR